MEDYLETIITILIGLGALLISALGRKKQSQGESKPVIEDWFEQEENDEVKVGDYSISEENTVDNFLFEEYENINTNVSKQTAMGETTSINDPPGQNISDQKISEITENEIYNHMEQKKSKKKRKFDGKKAIIYSAIINRKQF